MGHGRQEIVDVAAEPMQRLEAYSAFGEPASPSALELAQRLAGLAPMRDAKVFLATAAA